MLLPSFHVIFGSLFIGHHNTRQFLFRDTDIIIQQIINKYCLSQHPSINYKQMFPLAVSLSKLKKILTLPLSFTKLQTNTICIFLRRPEAERGSEATF
jgi:hypothetical protein